MTRRVVVTGIGAVTPFGDSTAALRDGLLQGRSAAGPISVFDASAFATRIAAEVPAAIAPATLVDRKARFAELAAQRAMDDAQRQGAALAAHYAGQPSCLSIGIGLELFSMPDMVRWLAADAPARPALQSHPDFLQPAADRCPHALTHLHGLTHWPQLHISACAASTDAIGRTFRQLRSGRLAWALAGGADSMINPMGIAGFCKIQAMTTRNGTPAQASRPFDRRRDGFLIGEGAALLVLETLDGALQRGAPVLAELLGYGSSFDAHGISEPHPTGAGALLAMQRALQDAGLSPDRIVQVNAHGTSTPKNDPAETSALRQLFAATHGDELAGLPVNATKSMLGHLIAASGAVEVAAQIACGNAGWVHPTINLDEPDADCRLDHVRGAPRRARPGPLLKNSFAFGGQNASLVLQPAC